MAGVSGRSEEVEESGLRRKRAINFFLKEVELQELLCVLTRREASQIGLLSVLAKASSEARFPATFVHNSEPAQTELSIDCDRQVDLIENTQEAKNL